MTDEENLNNNVSDDPNVTFQSRVFYENNGSVYGAEIVLLDGSNEKIKNILITDKADYQSWIDVIQYLEECFTPYSNQDLENLTILKNAREVYENSEKTDEDARVYNEVKENLTHSALKDIGGLEEILANDGNIVDINSTTLNGRSDYSLIGHTHNNYVEKRHNSATDEYGVGNETLYGHVKSIDGLSNSNYVAGECLSAHQGYRLNNMINEVDKKFSAWSKWKWVNNHLKYTVNPYIRLITLKYVWQDYKGLTKTGSHMLHNVNTIPDMYQPQGHIIQPIYRGDVTLTVRTDGSIYIYNLTPIDNLDIDVQFLWRY